MTSTRHENWASAATALSAGKSSVIWRKLVADTETPVGAAVKLIEEGRGDFLLESVEGGRTRGRYSLIGLDADLAFRARGDKAEINLRWRLDHEAFQPAHEPTLQALAKQGVERVDVICPGFVADCLETLEEIALEAKAAFLSAGGKEFAYVPALNEQPLWIDALGRLVERHLQGWPLQETPDPLARTESARRARDMGASA